jgi:peptidoglycan/LPS O-acetylase OafA/YrhL
MTSDPRNATIDLLRGIAILLVLILHFHLTYNLRQSPLGDVLPWPLLRALLVNGNGGVTMFFAISGFLITRNSIRRWGRLGAIDARRFYALRGARILPPLLLALGIIIALGIAGRPSFDNIEKGHEFAPSYFIVAAGSVLTFWHNVLLQRVGWFNFAMNIYWSLSVEEMFYLGLPLLCLILRRERWIVLACLVFIAAGPIYRGGYGDQDAFECAYLACFDAIAIGVVAALIAPHVHLGEKIAASIRIAAGVIIAATFYAGIWHHEVISFSLIALATSILLLLAPDEKPSTGLVALWPLRGLRWMGERSYELYVFHIIVLGLMRDALPHDAVGPAAKLAWFGAFLGLSIAVAGLIARHVSQPANRWLRRKLLTTPAMACAA